MEREYFVYILTNKSNRVLYTGVTNNLESRIWQHRNRLTPGFTSKYNFYKLVYYETHSDIKSAIFREKQIKSGSRSKKIRLIEEQNPRWHDLAGDW